MGRLEGDKKKIIKEGDRVETPLNHVASETLSGRRNRESGSKKLRGEKGNSMD